MIEVRNLTCGYGNSFHLQDVSFTVEAGGFWGIIGPNGSGKSTLLKALSKVLPFQSGEILIDNKSLRDLSLQDLAKIMAVVGSEAHFSFPFRVFDVVLMGRIPFIGRLGSFSMKDREIAEDSLKRTEAIDFRDRYIHQLSSGERQRVLLARALAQQPRILLLDEPTAHLDLHYEIEIFSILKRLNKDQLTVVAVSHNLNLMAEFSRMMIVLDHGKCRKIGPPQEILTPELLKEVFRIDSQIFNNPFSGAPSVMIDSNPD